MAAPSPTIASKPLILCVEDNEIYLRPRKAVLEQAGYAVLSASTGTEAMEILRDAPVCLVLSDHMLRGTTAAFAAAASNPLTFVTGTARHPGSGSGLPA